MDAMVSGHLATTRGRAPIPCHLAHEYSRLPACRSLYRLGGSASRGRTSNLQRKPTADRPSETPRSRDGNCGYSIRRTDSYSTVLLQREAWLNLRELRGH